MIFKSVLISCLVLSVFGSACGKKRKKSAAVEFFIHGDPLLLVNGNELSPSFLTLENFASYNDFHIAGATSFIEREPKAAPTSYEQVEKDNSTEVPEGKIENEFALVRYSFTQVTATRYVYGPIDGGKGYRLGFELKDGLLDMVDFNNYPVVSKHFSLKADGKAFSILVSYQDAAIGKLLTAFYFAASTPENPIVKATQAFAYLLANVKVRWDEPLKIEACGKFDPLSAESIKSSALAWGSDYAPSATQRPVIFSSRETFAPFSDLNQHCIFLISNFKLENSSDFYTAGVTLPVINLASKYIIDSDIMLFMDHPQVSRQVTTGTKSSILMHEMGHFYGLGHEFSTDPKGVPIHPSIMAYRNQTLEISPWDFDAIRELYGESLGLAP